MYANRRFSVTVTVFWAILLFGFGGCITSPETINVPKAMLTALPVKPSSSATITPLPSLTPKPSATFPLSPSPTLLPAISPTVALVKGPLPNIVINYSTHFPFECSVDDYNQIWAAKYPYEIPEPLLTNFGVDYNFPVWSPDGNWIAYVESKPADNFDLTNGRGVDSVWVIRPDGTEQHRVSDYVPRVNNQIGDCQPVSFIPFAPVWSPDGKFIIFGHTTISSGFNTSYYLTEVTSGITQVLNNGDNLINPEWFFNEYKIVSVGDKSEVFIFDIDAINNIVTTSVPPPIGLSASARFRIPQNLFHSAQLTNSSIIGTFYDADLNNISLWTLNIDTKEWSKLKDLQVGAFVNGVLGNNWVTTCYEQMVYILDETTWDVVNIFRSSEIIKVDCETFNVFQDNSGNDLVGFVGYIDENRDSVVDEYGIWIMQLQIREPVPEFIKIPVPKSNGEYSYSIVWFSFSPTP